MAFFCTNRWSRNKQHSRTECGGNFGPEIEEVRESNFGSQTCIQRMLSTRGLSPHNSKSKPKKEISNPTMLEILHAVHPRTRNKNDIQRQPI